MRFYPVPAGERFNDCQSFGAACPIMAADSASKP
jgi:hypothetical protein